MESGERAGQICYSQGCLEQAIATYLKGFETDWRDAYPGVNAVTLMELMTPPDPRQSELLPIVRYAVDRRIAGGQADYWDYATLLEIAVLCRDPLMGASALASALARVREAWEPETTARNLSLIRMTRAKRGESLAWADDAEVQLNRWGHVEPL